MSAFPFNSPGIHIMPFIYLLGRYICVAYTHTMIKSFADSETEKIWNGKKSPKLPPKLLIINSTEKEDDLRIPPGNKFEHLFGDLKEYCSIRINDQWRNQFKFLNTVEMSLRLSKYFRTTSKFWLNMQNELDLRETEIRLENDLKKIPTCKQIA